MSKVSFKYMVEDSHTFIRVDEKEPKIKVSTGEIIELDESKVDKGRMFLAGFRQLDVKGKVKLEGNDKVVRENVAKAKKEADEIAKLAASTDAENAKLAEGNVVPTITVPGSTDTAPVVTTDVKEDGQADITIKVTE